MSAQIHMLPPVEQCYRALCRELARRGIIERSLDPFPLAVMVSYRFFGDEMSISKRIKIAQTVVQLMRERRNSSGGEPPEVA